MCLIQFYILFPPTSYFYFDNNLTSLEMKTINKIGVILGVSIVAGLLGSFRITMKPSLMSAAIGIKPTKLGSIAGNDVPSKFWQCAKGTTIKDGQECKSENELMESIIERTRKPGYIVDGTIMNLHRKAEDYEWLATQMCYSDCINGVCTCPEDGFECLSQKPARRVDCKAEAEEYRKENLAQSRKELGAEVVELLAAADSAMDALKECTKNSAVTTGGACESQAKNGSSSFRDTFIGHIGKILFFDYEEHFTTKQYLAIESQRCYMGAKCENNICVCSDYFSFSCKLHTQEKTVCYMEAENVRKAYAAYAKAVDKRRLVAFFSSIDVYHIILGMAMCVVPFFIWKFIADSS